MEIKNTSSGTIKTFAKIMYVIGVVCTIIMTIGIIAASFVKGSDMNSRAILIGGIIAAAIFCVITILLLIVEKAFLMSYAEIAEDMREVRNILAKRDERS